ncbi:MAG: DUF86 domain-containing protein [Rhodospirillales bacterium]|nr:DUF86 domain-containing protein [Rhodospirillales bacterium]
MSRDNAVLLDIQEACQRIVEFTAGLEREEFLHDRLRQSAVLHQLLVLGEADKRIFEDTRSAAPQIPWGDIAGMRDKLIHAYHSVDIELVWEVTRTHVTQLLRDLTPLMPQPGEES